MNPISKPPYQRDTRVIIDPVLQLEQLHLQEPFGLLVLKPAQALIVGIVLPPGIDRCAVGLAQDGIIVVKVIDPQAPSQAAAGRS